MPDPPFPDQTTYCDLARQTFALSEAELRERLISVSADCDAYRALALAAVAQLADGRRQHEALTRRCRDLRNQLRVLVGIR
jgi:hypothetical protein